MFYHPNISLTIAPGGVFHIDNETATFTGPGNVTVVVLVPGADPPVNCSISTETETFYCVGQTEGNSLCKVTIFIGNEEFQEVNVTLTHIAYQPWKRQLLFYVDENAGSSLFLIMD